jgi:hypothetical protein
MQPGARRRQLDETLRTAYSEGLLSESTFMTRLDQVLGEATIGDYVSFAKRTLRVD